MKKISFIIFLFILTATSLRAQKKYTLEDVQDITLKSTGTIYEKNQIKGYYFLYITDKINRKTSQYVLEILDQNLNKVKKIPFEDSKDIKLLEAAYNVNNLAFLFDDLKKNQWSLKVFGIDGELKTSYMKQHEIKYEIPMESAMMNIDQFSNNQLFDVGENGFACIFKTSKLFSFRTEIFFYSTKKGNQWVFAEEKKNSDIKILGNTDNLLVLGISSYKTFKKGTFSIEGIDLKSGVKLSESNLDDDKFSMIPYNNAFENKGESNFIMVGVYVDKDAGMFNRGKGMIVCSLDNQGKLLNKTYNTWEDIGKYIKVSEKGNFDNLGYLFMKNLIKTQDGKSFLVFEGFDFRRTYDLVVFEFNKENKIVNSTIFPKTQNKIGRNTEAMMENPFDYQFTTSDVDNSHFSIFYKDYLRKEGIEKLSYKIINYSEGEFTNEKFDVDTKATIMKIFPAKAGSIMIFEYFRKEKRIDIRLEKLG